MYLSELAGLGVVFALILGGVELKVRHDLGDLADKLSNAEQYYLVSSVQPMGLKGSKETLAVMIQPRDVSERFLICHKEKGESFMLTTTSKSIITSGYQKILSRPFMEEAVEDFCTKAFVNT